MNDSRPLHASCCGYPAIQVLPGLCRMMRGGNDMHLKPDNRPVRDATEIPGDHRLPCSEPSGQQSVGAGAGAKRRCWGGDRSPALRIDGYHQVRDGRAGVEKADTSHRRNHPARQNPKSPGPRHSLVPELALGPAGRRRIATACAGGKRHLAGYPRRRRHGRTKEEQRSSDRYHLFHQDPPVQRTVAAYWTNCRVDRLPVDTTMERGARCSASQRCPSA